MFFGEQDRERVAALLRRTLRERGWTQRQAAQACGLSQATISKVLNANRVKSHNYRTLAAVLEVNLFERDSKEENEMDEASVTTLPVSRDGRVVVVAIEKGGSGKTTTVINLASAWSKAGKRVLVVDLDPQGHATLHAGLEKGGEDTIEALRGGEPLRPVATEHGFDVVPGGPELDNMLLLLQSSRNPIVGVRRVLAPLRAEYDLIVLDTSPSLDVRMYNCLVASDFVVLPVQPERGAIDGLASLYEVLEELRIDYPHIQLLGTLPTKVRRVSLHRTNVLAISRTPHLRPLDVHIPESVCIAEAFDRAMPALEYAPKEKATKAYRKAARVLLDRMDEMCARNAV